MATDATGDGSSANENAHEPPPYKDKSAGPIPKRNKGGAPYGSANRLTHGLYSPRGGGRLTSQFVVKMTSAFRRAVETLVMRLRGEVSLSDACLIHTATEAYKLAQSNREVTAKYAEELKPEIRATLDGKYLSFLETRDRNIRLLGLDTRDLDASDSGLDYATLQAAAQREAEREAEREAAASAATPAPTDATLQQPSSLPQGSV